MMPLGLAALLASQLVSYPGPWAFQLPKSSIIFVSDQELVAMSDNPDARLNLTLGRGERHVSLREECERARARGQRTLIVAFDHFFRQYRPGQDTPRRLTPATDEYVQRIARISRFAEGYGLGLELSLLSPLELGAGFEEKGLWMHYREGFRDPRTGAFSVELWRQQQWANNKGVVAIEDAGVRVFAFRETRVGGTPYRVVDPAAIVEIQGQVELLGENAGARRIRVHGAGGPPGLDRVLVVQQYRTPEIDYFSPRAPAFLHSLVDRYANAGIRLNALYSDEIHIQQDWGYFNHHDHGEFALRFCTPNLARAFAERYGEQYRDFAKYLVYFAHGQEDFARDLTAKQETMHVFGASPEAVRRTAQFRARYYRMLQDSVTELFVQAKRHAERRFGHKLEARAHATWAQSPTIDYWDTGRQHRSRSQYEYTSNFVWSNTVHQAASACYDYFRWGDFLTGNGNDHTEGGWLDRNYYGLALAASTGVLNEVPYSYAAHWGMPAEVSRRRSALVNACGAGASAPFAMVEDMQHRDADVLMLYPLDLVAVDERFGSWMTQYGYANYVTADKLLERGRVEDGAVRMAGRRFTTVVALFEPFPSDRLLAFLRELVAAGGRVIWSGPPPALALAPWQEIFGVEYTPGVDVGLMAPGKVIEFEGALAKVAPQVILTDFLVDRIYPVRPRQGTAPVARVKGEVVGTRRGNAVFLGFRPRDDQSRSLGYDARTWFDILDALGAYPGADNTERLSRTGPYLTCRFPNGAVGIAPHLREYEESWPGGFSRNPEEDAKIVRANPPPPEAIRLRDYTVNGHVVSYDGVHAVAFRPGLTAFAGRKCREITLDGRRYVFADREMAEIAWAPVGAERRVPGGAVLEVIAAGAGSVRVPFAEPVRLVSEAGAAVPSRFENGTVVFEVTKEISGKRLFGVR